jgi:hypothetical protein
MKQDKWPSDSAVKELLKLAKIPNNADNRRCLCVALEHAKRDYNDCTGGQRRAVGRKTCSKVARAARVLIQAMNELDGSSEPDGWITNREIVQAEVSRVRDAAENRAHAAKGRGRPSKYDKSVVVRGALMYLYLQSNKRRLPSEKFTELFYKTVTGNVDNVEHQIANETKRIRTLIVRTG